MKRLVIDLKESSDGDIRGRITFPADSVFVLECLEEVITQFSKSCEVPPHEILDDLRKLIR
jgi:hypothetical protein